MADHTLFGSPSKPRPVPGSSSPHGSLGRSSAVACSASRAEPTGRHASPAPAPLAGTPPIPQIPTPSQLHAGSAIPLAGPSSGPSGQGPGGSEISAALQGSFARSPPRFAAPVHHENVDHYKALDWRQSQIPRVDSVQSGMNENPEVVKRYLVQAPGDEGTSAPRFPNPFSRS
jgi:hypothetical protein